jgi:MFS family permease
LARVCNRLREDEQRMPEGATPRAIEMDDTASSQSSAEAEARFQREVLHHLPRNFTAQMVHGLMGRTGFQLIQAPTFIPAYVYALSGSNAMVGVARASQAVGTFITPVFGATLIEHRRRVLPMVFATGASMRLAVLGLALSGYFLGTHANLIAICLCLGLYGFFSGMQMVTFSFLVAKLVPVDRRGALGGARAAAAGLMASGVGVVGGYLIKTDALGNGYASVFLISFTMAAIGLFSLLMIREPESPEVRPQQPFVSRLREVPALWSTDADYRAYMWARALGAGGRLAVPYYAIYATQQLHLPIESIGWVTAAYVVSQNLSVMAWGLVGDRHGFRRVLGAALLIWTGATLLLMYSAGLTPVLAGFVGLGAGLGGFELACTNLVLEFGSREDLPMRIALAQSGEQGVSIAAPLVGALLVETLSYRHMFWAAVLVQSAALAVTTFKLDEPRHRAASAV